LKELQEEEMRKNEERKRSDESKAEKIMLAQKSQEEYAKGQYEDFDGTLKLGEDLVKNIDTLEPLKRKKVKSLLDRIRTAASRADELSVEDYNVADLSYELGQLHPDYGKKGKNEEESQSQNGNGEKPEAERINGGLTTEQVERIEKNAARRGSSASLSGSGGRRMVSVEDITISDLLKLDSHQYEAFRSKHPDKVRQLLREG
jgi:hypothetical protein